MTTVVSPSTILYDEHEAISAVLSSLETAIAALERGERVSPGIFHDLDEFFRLFVGQCHHGKEEQLLFPALQDQPQIAAMSDLLEREHRQGSALEHAFSEAVERYATDGPAAAPGLAAAARAYIAMLRGHIERENTTLLPLVEERSQQYSSNGGLLAAFERFEDEVMGAGTHERLHRMIETLEPRLAAYGSGDRP